MTPRKLLIHWTGQLDASSTAGSDCGQACVVMLLRYYRYAGPDAPMVDDLSRLAPGKTSAQDLSRLALTATRRDHPDDPLRLAVMPRMAAADLRGYVRASHPIILLVDYIELEPAFAAEGYPNHLASGPDQGWHWLACVGYEKDTFYVHDPLWTPAQRGGQGGAYIPIPADVLIEAQIGNSSLIHADAAPAPAPRRGSKLGVHIVGGPRNGYGDFLKARPALVKAVDEGGALVEAKRISPETVTIFRTRHPGDTPQGNFTGSPVEVAEQWMALHMPVWAQNPADYYEPVNEPDPPTLAQYTWLDLFTQTCMQVAEASGCRLCLYNFASGVPEPAEFAQLLPSLAYAARMGHILGLHEYGLPGLMRAGYPHLATRYRMYQKLLEEAQVYGLRIAVTEAAPFGGYEWDRLGREAFLADVRWYDSELRKDDYVIGFALYSLGQWEGHRNNFQDAMPELTAIVERGRFGETKT